MASDDKDSPSVASSGDGGSDTSKRPSRVIDLEAAEVRIEDKSDAEPGQDEGGEADASDRGAKTQDRSAKARPAAPPPRAKPTDIKGFVTHLAAGLAGGLIGVVGAGTVLDRMPPDAQTSVPQVTSQEIQKIGQRLDALDTTLAEQAKSTSGAVPEAVSDAMRALNRIEARLAVVEERPEAAAPDLKPLEQRLDKLEAALQSLPAPQTPGAEAEEGTPAAPPPGSLSEKIDDVSRKLERRTASLGADIEALKSVLDARPAAQTEDTQSRIGALETRLAALENKPEAPAPDLQPLTDRLAKLEAGLQRPPAPGAEAGVESEAPSTALSEKINDVSRKLERRTATLGADIEALKSAVEARPAAPAEANESQIEALAPRLDALESKIAKLASRPPSPVVQISPGRNGAAVTLAIEILRRTIDRGEPYGTQLKALENAAPAGLDLSALAAHAETGLRTDGALLAALTPALRAAREAAARSDDDTFLDRLVANARSVVRVRRIGEAEGTDAAAILSRMEAHMKAADLPGVLRQAEDLSGPALSSLRPWLEMAQAKRDVRTALAEIERGLLAGLQSGGGADKSR